VNLNSTLQVLLCISLYLAAMFVTTLHTIKPSIPVQVLLCIFLFSVALFITTVIAKLLASYFHKQAFFDKMQATLTQVCCKGHTHLSPPLGGCCWLQGV
jgi:uncharacterized membrane protein